MIARMSSVLHRQLNQQLSHQTTCQRALRLGLSRRPQHRRGISTSAAYLERPDEGSSGRVNIFTDYVVYKGRGAMSIKLIKPTWERTATGSGLKVARAGTVLLEFANARGERDYDWEGKESFALSAVECGDVLEAVEANGDKQFFHDPNKGAPGEGAITKSFRVNPGSQSGYFFSLTVNSKCAGSTRYDTVVSVGELRVIRTLLDFAIPHILGFDEMFAGAPMLRDTTAPTMAAGQPPF